MQEEGNQKHHADTTDGGELEEGEIVDMGSRSRSARVGTTAGKRERGKVRATSRSI